MQTRRLGRLGHMSSVLIYGGAALSEVSQDEADRSIGAALEAGINHFDTGGRLRRVAISDTGSLFEHSAGRVVPDWLAHLLPSEQ
jgi:hypothetical protein